MSQHGTVVWNELNTHDVEAAKAFYAATLGWTFEPMEMADRIYWIVKAGDHTVGGIFELAGADLTGVPPHWFTYIEVDDVDRRAELALAAGGALLRPPFDIGGVGRIAIVKDAEGAVLGFMTSIA
ncbi:MAG TPA: VOC family protein [Xanthobacteraceae bacterium]|nr:VOC family protein [Xanthobacteraceae bacterium]